jgi:hypothetical protein
MAIKFSQLISTTSLSDNDLFAVTDDSNNTSVKITFGDLKTIVVDDNTFLSKRAGIVTALNQHATDYNTDDSLTPLNASKLGGQLPAYYLDWTNVTSKPAIATDLHDLNNIKDGGGFVKYVADGANSKLIFQIRQNDTDGAQTDITTSYLIEGTNKYYTDTRVEEYLQENFQRFFNDFSTSFDQGDVVDSYFDTVGYAVDVEGGVTNKIRIKTEGSIPGLSADATKRDQTGRFDAYKAGKAVRIFGADPAGRTPMTSQLNDPVVSSEGFTFVADVSAGASPSFGIDDVDVNTNSIAMTGHAFQTGDAVIYNSGTSTVIGNLEDGTTYYVIDASTDSISLATTFADAGSTTARNLLQGGTGTTHSLTPVVVSPAPYQRLTYSVCEWNLSTGQISEKSNDVSINISVPAGFVGTVSEYLLDDREKLVKAFSIENFVKLSFTHELSEGTPAVGVSPGRGLAIYRKISQINTIDPQLAGAPKLVAVLGPGDLKNNFWIDYYTDDVVNHSNKNQEDNSYLPEKTVHFKPIAPPPTQPQRGWFDVSITDVEYQNPVVPAQSDYIDVVISNSIIASTVESEGVWISHNDTSRINTAIITNANSGRTALQLNPKGYIVSNLIIPSNFSVQGFAYNTQFTKLPWSGYNGSDSASTNRIISGEGVVNTSIVGIDIDGNAVNTVLFDDSTTESKNYAINFGRNTESVLVDKVRIKSVIGGGIFVPDSQDFKITSSEVVDSLVTDRYVYAPMLAQGGSNTFISSTRFENFPQSGVDVSVTNKGVIQGNIISNCGPGLVMFGSRFLVTSPNILTGPSGEFLPNPDAYNSEFDSINIDLTESVINDPISSFASGFLKYQENGELYDLSEVAGVDPVTYKLFAIKKTDGGEESIWIEDLRAPTGETANTIVATLDATSHSNFNENGDTVTTTTAHGFSDGDPVVYRQNDGSLGAFTDGETYYVQAIAINQIQLYDTRQNAIQGSSQGRVNIIKDGVNSPSTDSAAYGDNHTFTRSLYLDMLKGDDSSNPPSEGGFQFTIPADSVRKMKVSGYPYTVEYMQNGSNTIFHTDENGDFAASQGDPDHIGIGWSVSVKAYVKAGIIQNDIANPAVWGAPYVDSEDGLTYANYTVAVTDYKYLYQGRKIKLTLSGSTPHTNFSPDGAGANPAAETYGIIHSVTGPEEQKTVTIKWLNANAQVDVGNGPENSATPGVGGTIEVEDTFVIATGRIR